MEVPSATLSTLDTSHYDDNNTHAINAALALQAELQDRSFDLGDEVDEDVDLQTAFASQSKQENTIIGGKQEGTEDDDEDSDLLDEADDLDVPIPPDLDPFPEEVADEMIEELKEIGMFRFIQKYVGDEEVPLPKLLYVFGIIVPPSDEPENPVYLLRLLKIAISRTLRNRIPLDNITSPSDFISLLRSSQKIVILTGAGISTNCGIPDFRSPSGIYARLVASGNYPELTDPQEMFDMNVFLDNPEIFYSFAKELYPSNDGVTVVEGPSSAKKAGKVHHWIKSLEEDNKLLRNYTQNIDTLEMMAGIERVLFAHGSFATCSCVVCKTQYPGDAIKDSIFSQTVPMCPVCQASEAAATSEPPSKKRRLANGSSAANGGDDDEEENYVNPWKGKPILKPDITFFGQALDDAFDRCLLEDREEVDLLVVVGTSLQVAPVSELLSHIPHRVPQILINRDPVPHVMQHVDLALLGDCDKIIDWIAAEVGKDPDTERAASTNTANVKAVESKPALEGIDNIWLFEGANEDHRWLTRMREALAEESEVGGEEDETKQADGQEEATGGSAEPAANGSEAVAGSSIWKALTGQKAAEEVEGISVPGSEPQ